VKAFIDFQNDVTAKDIRLAVREGMHSIEHVKRFTTNGMATDQGKLSNMHGLAIAAEALGRPIPQVGLTTFRSPYTPVTFGTIVNHAKGPLFDPTRRTSMYENAAAMGAVFEDVGQWKRAWYFPRPGEGMHEAVDRECVNVRTNAGLFDASTLGKIEVVGPDAAKFLNILYTNSWDKLGVGKCRYGIMLREDGFIYDDGVVGRIAADRFHVTTTTGGAPRVMSHMEDYLQTEFPDLNVWLTSTTEQWAVIAVQGPKAREIIAPFVTGMDISNEAFPHMSVKECQFMGVPCRLFRMTFAGELGFEINVPTDFGPAVWDAIYKHGAPMGLQPYGTEAMHVLRAEKGYIIVGQDTDGTVTPQDAGLAWAIAKSKPDFVGIRGLKRVDLVAAVRKQLVGLRTKDPKTVLEEGAQIVANPNQAIPMTMIGHVTSSYWSANCGRSIAMALIAGGKDRMGKTLYVPMPDRNIEVEICDAVFFDKEGGRINA
jgi:sarcosine oxidase, subunit alpha